jgi:diguanylate cyclase (GGDEF)-like protein
MPDLAFDDSSSASSPTSQAMSAPSYDPVGGSSGSTLEWVLRSLLRVRGVDEAQRVALDLLRAASSAQWGAMYVEQDGLFRLLGCSPEPHRRIGESIPPEAVAQLLGGGGLPVLCPQAVAAREHVAPDLAVVAPLELADSTAAVILLGPPLHGGGYDDAALLLIHRVVDACSIALQNAELVESLRSQVFIDFLTGCYNRRGFDAHMKVEVGRAHRYDRPLSLLLVDIDHFKWINDSMGHPVGDYALRRLGDFMLSAFRTTDWVCRFGGDEFAVIFPETRKDEVARLAERLRVKIASLFPDDVLRRGMSASVGVASLPADGDDPEHLLQAADRALYRAKGSGRNRVVIA